MPCCVHPASTAENHTALSCHRAGSIFLIDQLEVSEVVAAAEMPHNGVLHVALAGCSCLAGV